jgi:hypothetical protein
MLSFRITEGVIRGYIGHRSFLITLLYITYSSLVVYMFVLSIHITYSSLVIY